MNIYIPGMLAIGKKRQSKQESNENEKEVSQWLLLYALDLSIRVWVQLF